MSISLFLVMIGCGIGYIIYNQSHQNIRSAQADFKMTATELFSDFEANETTANTKYLDKIIDLEGEIQSVSETANKTSITLEAGGILGGVICQLDESQSHKRASFKAGEMVQFRGICTGMLMDVVLVRCVEL